MKNKAIFSALLLALVMASSASAMVLSSLDYNPIAPGKESRFTITIKNTFDNEVTDVSLSLDLAKLALKDSSRLLFTAVGSSEDSVDKIKSGKAEEFFFTLRASSEIIPGEYSIPYELSYYEKDSKKIKTGSIGVVVASNPLLEAEVYSDKPIVGKEGKLNIKIVNKGLADARFVSLRIFPDGLNLLSSDSAYIGTISSDDFETETFDVIFKTQDALISGVVEYKDFNNNLLKQNFNLPLQVYSVQKAYELGMLKKSYIPYYIGGALLIIVLWLIWRSISKRRKLRRSMQAQEG
jgi:hypothetical protein